MVRSIRSILAGVLAVAVAGLFAEIGEAYVAGPPPAMTGGFRESGCQMCHIDYALNDSAGSLRLEGVPEAYTPGERYNLTIRLMHPVLERGGFEVAARFASGAQAGQQAGTFEALDARTAVVKSDSAIQYARQTRAGSSPDSKGSIQWSIRWQAPEPNESGGLVTFHLAANAANYDDSPLGDYPYIQEVTSKSR